MKTINAYRPGDRVIANGNNDATILRIYDAQNDLYEVRLWQGLRHVGDICLAGRELKPLYTKEV